MSNILLNMDVDESLRLELLAQEKKMRQKQPEAWTKTKFRKYANFGRNRKKTAEELLGLTSTRTDTTNLAKIKTKK
ncbi:MAG TPA: hypothetical protein PKK60_00685 [archaeon]|nr:hypothetical protein [archaeon]